MPRNDVKRVFYAAAGPANLIDAHKRWAAGEHDPSEVSITFSSQIEDFCTDLGADLMMTSVHPDGATLNGDGIRIAHLPKRPAKGLSYHLEEFRYGRDLARRAKAFGADLAILDSGVTHYFMMRSFARAGIPVIVVLHNTLWPHAFRPTGKLQRIIQKLNAAYWRNGPLAGIAVSPEAERQTYELAPGHHTPIHQIRAQFHRAYFQDIPPAPPHGQRPFQVMFIGRVDRIKGVLDIPAMAREIEKTHPGAVRWVICGRGPQLAELEDMVRAENLGHIITLKGWVSLEDLQRVYTESHAAIVPTCSLFEEGLAMTAVEAILAGRPLVTNPVVPAAELLAPAVLLAATDDPASHARAVLTLANDRAAWETARDACKTLEGEFYDRSFGLTAVLHRALGGDVRPSELGVAEKRQSDSLE